MLNYKNTATQRLSRLYCSYSKQWQYCYELSTIVNRNWLSKYQITLLCTLKAHSVKALNVQPLVKVNPYSELESKLKVLKTHNHKRYLSNKPIMLRVWRLSAASPFFKCTIQKAPEVASETLVVRHTATAAVKSASKQNRSVQSCSYRLGWLNTAVWAASTRYKATKIKGAGGGTLTATTTNPPQPKSRSLITS